MPSGKKRTTIKNLRKEISVAIELQKQSLELQKQLIDRISNLEAKQGCPQQKLPQQPTEDNKEFKQELWRWLFSMPSAASIPLATPSMAADCSVFTRDNNTSVNIPRVFPTKQLSKRASDKGMTSNTTSDTQIEMPSVSSNSLSSFSINSNQIKPDEEVQQHENNHNSNSTFIKPLHRSIGEKKKISEIAQLIDWSSPFESTRSRKKTPTIASQQFHSTLDYSDNNNNNIKKSRSSPSPSPKKNGRNKKALLNKNSQKKPATHAKKGEANKETDLNFQKRVPQYEAEEICGDQINNRDNNSQQGSSSSSNNLFAKDILDSASIMSISSDSDNQDYATCSSSEHGDSTKRREFLPLRDQALQSTCYSAHQEEEDGDDQSSGEDDGSNNSSNTHGLFSFLDNIGRRKRANSLDLLRNRIDESKKNKRNNKEE